MRSKIRMGVCLVALASLTACVVAPPSGPSPYAQAMPGQGKNFDQFNADDTACREWAANRTNTPSAQQQQNNQVGTALGGAALGAIAGALVGSAAGHVGTGAAVGAGIGALGGAAVAGNQSQGQAMSSQQTYDVTYDQCMAAKGNAVRGYYQGGPPPGY